MKVIVEPWRSTATEATSSSLPARAGNARTFGAARLTPRSPAVSVTIASTTRTTVAQAKGIRDRCRIASRLRGAPVAAAQPQHTEGDGDYGDDKRDQRDVEKSEPPLEARDIAAQRRLDIAQLAAGLQHVGAKLLDRLGLLRREGRRRVRLILAGEARELLLCFFELGLQRALFGAIARLRVPLDFVDELEWPRRGAARPQSDKVLAAGQDLDCVGDKIAVVRGWSQQPVSKEILFLQPEFVIEQVGIGDNDDIDRLCRLLQRLARRSCGFCRRFRLSFFSFGFGGGFGRFWRAVRKRALGWARDAGGEGVAL